MLPKPIPQGDQATAQPTPAGTPAQPPRRPPLTTAERQRRHRIKKKIELEGLNEKLSDGLITKLTRENLELKIELKKAQEIAQEKAFRLKEIVDSCARKDEITKSAKDCIRTALYRASPGAKSMIESSLRERGYIEWLNSE